MRIATITVKELGDFIDALTEYKVDRVYRDYIETRQNSHLVYYSAWCPVQSVQFKAEVTIPQLIEMKNWVPNNGRFYNGPSWNFDLADEDIARFSCTNKQHFIKLLEKMGVKKDIVSPLKGLTAQQLAKVYEATADDEQKELSEVDDEKNVAEIKKMKVDLFNGKILEIGTVVTTNSYQVTIEGWGKILKSFQQEVEQGFIKNNIRVISGSVVLNIEA